MEPARRHTIPRDDLAAAGHVRADPQAVDTPLIQINGGRFGSCAHAHEVEAR
jgi:hypothetical protein